MIQSLRTRHRWAFSVLAVLIPLVFVAGLKARYRSVGGAQIPAEAVLVAPQDPTWQNHLVLVQTSTTADGQHSLRLLPIKPIVAPDLLVYHAQQIPQPGRLPEDAHLLGRWDANSSYSAPSGGYLLLYSGAQKTVLDTIPLGGRP